MAEKNNHSGRRSKSPRQGRPDEDEHPIEGYRDGSVYEEQGGVARTDQTSQVNLPNKSRVSGGDRGVKSDERRK